MGNSLIKNIISIVIIVILFVITFRLLRWVAITLLPIAVMICAAYIVYKLVNKNK